jgi:hypothetical protein
MAISMFEKSESEGASKQPNQNKKTLTMNRSVSEITRPSPSRHTRNKNDKESVQTLRRFPVPALPLWDSDANRPKSSRRLVKSESRSSKRKGSNRSKTPRSTQVATRSRSNSVASSSPQKKQKVHFLSVRKNLVHSFFQIDRMEKRINNKTRSI